MLLVSQLSPSAKEKIKLLSGPRPLRFVTTLLLAWLVIGLTIYTAVACNSLVVSIVAMYIIATRQNILALLIHEQTHYLGLRGRFGDLIVNCFASYPLIAVTIEGYARVHLSHHRFYFSAEDPDFLRKKGPDWTFPMSHAALAKLFLQDLCGLSFVRYVMAKPKPSAEMAGRFRRKHPSPAWLRPCFYGVVLTGIALAGAWSIVLLYWAVPLVTIFPAIVRWSAICEHSYGQEGATVEETSPVILPTVLSRILLPNLNFTMHVYHHYFPGVSFSALPQVHQIFADENLVRADQVFSGHLDYLRYVTKGPREVPAMAVSAQCAS